MRAFGAAARYRPPAPLAVCGALPPLLRARPAVMIWLVGLLTAALFAYLFYALIKPEKF
jgi:K+-transporting ATPase KdpF subunit